MHARIHTCLQKNKDKTIPSRLIFMCHYVNLIFLEMDGRSKRPLPWGTIASYKLHASEYETIYCKYSHYNQQIRQQLLALLKSTARMPESMFVDKKETTIPSHHDISSDFPLHVPHMP